MALFVKSSLRLFKLDPEIFSSQDHPGRTGEEPSGVPPFGLSPKPSASSRCQGEGRRDYKPLRLLGSETEF